MIEFDGIFGLMAIATFLAGMMDGAMGGGGILQVAALQLLYPQLSWMQVFAVNKTVSTCGTGIAFCQYATHAATPTIRRRLWLTLPFCVLAAVAGAMLINSVDKDAMRWLVIILLSSVAMYVFFRPYIGHYTADDKKVQAIPVWKWIVLALPIAAYDGFFGPGTGAFALFGSVVLLHLSFLQAQAVAKAWNFSSNIGALFYFIFQGYWFPQFFPLTLVNMLGNWVGSKIVIKYGSQLVRKLFLVVVAVLIGRLLYQALSPYFFK